ncbi:MAG: cytosolic protein, partial [Gammaproteobacteria bacterium]|nr:cytosolic protein [Gammaproteobacteria bacterium]
MAQYDSPWKIMLEKYFEHFTAFFFPRIHQDIDWSKGHTFLDKELEAVVHDAELGKREADKLVRVHHKNGAEGIIFVHVEVQCQDEAHFAKRMYVYNYRLYDRYGRRVVSLAVLGDDRPRWRPDTYGYNMWGFEIRMKFPIVKLLDFRKDWKKLEESENPFAFVVMAHLKSKETRNRPQERLFWKWTITRALYHKDYTREEVLNLLRFLDWMVDLPSELEQQFIERVETYKGG